MKQPTMEQMKVIEYDGNCVITACPGSGKTFTIVEKIKCHTKNLKSYEGIVAISYTNKAADEIKNRLKGKNKKNFFIGTIDRFCLSEIIFPFSKFLIKKNIDSFEIINNDNSGDKNFDYYVDYLNSGKIPLNYIADISFLILNRIPECVNYLKAKYKMIFVDEYQDCEENQHLIWKFLCQQGIKLIAVGDVDQSIYSSFTDSNPEFLRELMTDEKFKSFVLSINHRSHQSIVEYAMRFKNEKYSTMNDMDLRVSKVNISGNERQIVSSIEKNIAGIKSKYTIEAMSNIAIFCRSNAMVSRVCQFLTIPHKDYSLNAFKVENDFNRFCKLLLVRFFQFKNKEVTKKECAEELVNLYKEKELYDNIKKNIDCLFSQEPEKLYMKLEIICSLYSETKKQCITEENRSELYHVLQDINLLNTFKPAEKDEIQVMTYHKSKGLEFDVVFLMDCYKYILPKERQDRYDNLEADENLHYVGLTRGKKAVYILIGTERYRVHRSDYISAIESIFLSRNGLAKLRRYEDWN